MGSNQSATDVLFDDFVKAHALMFSSAVSEKRFQMQFFELLQSIPKREGIVAFTESAKLHMTFEDPKRRRDPVLNVNEAVADYPNYDSDSDSDSLSCGLSSSDKSSIASAVADTFSEEEQRINNPFNQFQNLLKGTKMPRSSVASFYVVWKIAAEREGVLEITKAAGPDERSLKLRDHMERFIMQHQKATQFSEIPPELLKPTTMDRRSFEDVIINHQGLHFTSSRQKEKLLFDWVKVLRTCPKEEGLGGAVDFFTQNLRGLVNPRLVLDNGATWPSFEATTAYSPRGSCRSIVDREGKTPVINPSFLRSCFSDCEPLEVEKRINNPYKWFQYQAKLNNKKLPKSTSRSLYVLWRQYEKEAKPTTEVQKEQLLTQFLAKHFGSVGL